jgi:hypothetical protein
MEHTRRRDAVTSLRQHTSAYVSISQHQHTSAYVSIRRDLRCSSPSLPSYVSIRQHTSAYVSIRQHTSAYVSMRQHTSEYVSIRQHAGTVAGSTLLPATPSLAYMYIGYLFMQVPVWESPRHTNWPHGRRSTHTPPVLTYH